MESPRTWTWTTALLALLAARAGPVAAGSVRYDQTQTGDTNIHLEVKNVEVLALLDDSSLEQYEYDYHDLTEKPPKPGANSTWSAPDPVVEAANATERPVLGPTAVPGHGPADNATAPAPADNATAPETPAPGKRARRCGSGYHRDANGHCRRTRRPNLQMLMHLGRKPSQPVEGPPAPTAA